MVLEEVDFGRVNAVVLVFVIYEMDLIGAKLDTEGCVGALSIVLPGHCRNPILNIVSDILMTFKADKINVVNGL